MDTLVNDSFISGIFLFVGLVFMVLELFVPTAGVLGFLALAAIIFGIYGLFHQGHPVIATLVVAFFLAAFWMMFRFLLSRLNFKGSLPPETATSVDSRIADLVGKEGVALTSLRPAGMAKIEGRKVDVVALGDFIEKDAPVRVVDNSGNRVVVRQLESRSMKV